ncbi:MAG: hypothetical protein AAF591_02215 [Verrucomicrobiota bacterium]
MMKTPPLNTSLRQTLLPVALAGLLTLAFALQMFAQGFGGPPPGSGPNGNDNSDRGPRPKGPPPADVLAGHLMSEFDTNGDQALDQTELTAALEALHQRRPKGPPPNASDDARPSRPAY